MYFSISDVPLHVFPDPAKYPERFRAWVTIVGGKLETHNDYEEYRKRKLCDIHFTDKDRNRNHRLNALAVPSVHLPSKLDFFYCLCVCIKRNIKYV